MELQNKGTDSLESRTVTICSGLDFVNVNYTNMVAADEKTAKVRNFDLLSKGISFWNGGEIIHISVYQYYFADYLLIL